MPKPPRYRPARKGQRSLVLVRSWFPTRTLGRLMLIVGLLRVRGNRQAGLADAVDAVMRGGTKPLLTGASVEELNAACECAVDAFPSLGGMLQAVKSAAGDTYRRRTDSTPNVTE